MFKVLDRVPPSFTRKTASLLPSPMPGAAGVGRPPKPPSSVATLPMPDDEGPRHSGRRRRKTKRVTFGDIISQTRKASVVRLFERARCASRLRHLCRSAGNLRAARLLSRLKARCLNQALRIGNGRVRAVRSEHDRLALIKGPGKIGALHLPWKLVEVDFTSALQALSEATDQLLSDDAMDAAARELAAKKWSNALKMLPIPSEVYARGMALITQYQTAFRAGNPTTTGLAYDMTIYRKVVAGHIH